MLEIDSETGERGQRQEHVRGLLRKLTGAEDACVLNNNAGATFLAVTALAAGKQVIISRGELVEIGGSFRMPDIIRASGATPVEVGTTNRTRLSDYENAITADTGLILRCHPSNFKQIGFTETTTVADLVALGKRARVPVVDDLGSGSMIRMDAASHTETTLREAVATGCDLVTASGDKLLGGPQAGIVLGKTDAVRRVANHPLARALRIDKLTLAALEATLRLYRDEERAREEIPALQFLSRQPSELSEMANRLMEQIQEAAGTSVSLDVVTESSQTGGGSLPGESLPTCCVRIRPANSDMKVNELARKLRMGRPAIFARIKDDAILFDPRTLFPEELSMIAAAVSAAVTHD
jgi:L-seryl-tRNA(Ser) seleniumtransferase